MVGRQIVADRVIRADGSPLVDDGMISTADGRIVHIGPRDRATPLPDHADRYVGCTALPGLIDCHAHVTLASDGRTYEAMMQDPDEMLALVSVPNLSRHLAAGVTTVRDNGGRGIVPFVVRDAVERGYLTGPRVLASGSPITPPGDHMHWCGGAADGIDAIRAAVHRLVEQGADHIKVIASGGASQGSSPTRSTYGFDELRTAVETSHALERTTTAHCRARAPMADVIRAGFDCIEHAEFIVEPRTPGDHAMSNTRGEMVYEPELAAMLEDHGTWISYTIQAGGYAELVGLRDRQREHPTSPQGERRTRQLEEYFASKVALLSELVRAGLAPQVVISSDAGPSGVPFGLLHQGLELAVEAGMSPSEAIDSVTSKAARVCGLAGEVGALTPGSRADVLVVRGDPTRDIRDLAEVVAVYQGGERVVPPPIAG